MQFPSNAIGHEMQCATEIQRLGLENRSIYRGSQLVVLQWYKVIYRLFYTNNDIKKYCDDSYCNR